MTALRLLPLAFRTRSTARYKGPGMLTATLVASLPISSPPDGWYAESITRVIPTGKAHTGVDEPSGQHGPPADRSPPALGEGRQDGRGLQGPADAGRRPRAPPPDALARLPAAS